MQNNKSIKMVANDNHIENALNSLSNINRATPQPFFYTRLMARFNDQYENKWEKYGTIITRPSVAFSGIFLIVLMNLLAAYLNLKTPVTSDPGEAIVTEEYTQLATNFYDLENIKP